MPDVLNEVTAGDLTRDDVQRRVDDWVERIENLYRQVESWLPPGWTPERRRSKSMHEELMRDFGLPPRELPILDLAKDGAHAGTLEPRGLWILGANGRLDLLVGTDHYVIVDVAQNLERPVWRFAPLSDRRKLEDFNESKFLSVI